jgi:hypothetical protein
MRRKRVARVIFDEMGQFTFDFFGSNCSSLFPRLTAFLNSIIIKLPYFFCLVKKARTDCPAPAPQSQKSF